MARDARVTVGTVYVVCPVCDARMPAAVSAEVVDGEADGRVNLACTPDMTDVWAHMWLHEDAEA